jgi:hypothetical protein
MKCMLEQKAGSMAAELMLPEHWIAAFSSCMHLARVGAARVARDVGYQRAAAAPSLRRAPKDSGRKDVSVRNRQIHYLYPTIF